MRGGRMREVVDVMVPEVMIIGTVGGIVLVEVGVGVEDVEGMALVVAGRGAEVVEGLALVEEGGAGVVDEEGDCDDDEVDISNPVLTL